MRLRVVTRSDPPFPSTTLFLSSACPSGQPSGTFSAVAGDNPHRRSIDCVADHSIAQGTSAGRFSPALDVTRAQMASFVARMIPEAGGSLSDSPPDAFSDDTGSEIGRASCRESVCQYV